MTILRTVCPKCDVVRVRAPEVTLCQPTQADHLEVDFVCPTCAGHVVQVLNSTLLGLLVNAGCSVRTPDEGDICELEIQDFVRSLDRLDWADELAH